MLYCHCQFSNLCWIWSSAKVNSACLLRIFNLSLRAMSCLRKTSRTPLKRFLYYCFEDKYYFLFKNDHFLKKKKKKMRTSEKFRGYLPKKIRFPKLHINICFRTGFQVSSIVVSDLRQEWQFYALPHGDTEKNPLKISG